MPSKKGSKWVKKPEDSVLRWEYYMKQDPSRSQDECEMLASKRRKARNKGSIEYYELHYPHLSHDEHVLILKEFQENYKRSQPTHIEYWVNKYPDLPIEEQEKLFRNYMRSTNGGCIEFYERKYPNKTPAERQDMLNEWLKNHQSHRPKLVGDKNPGHSKNTTVLERKQRSPKCIEFYELRYPNLSHDERMKMLEEHKSKVTKILQNPKNQVLCIEYWLDKGFSIEESEQKLKDEYQKRSFTLDKCIEKYGEVDGPRKFEERQIKWQKTLHEVFEKSRIYQSYLANQIINNITVVYSGEAEYLVGKYSFDFRYKNILVEINGDYWHMNPNLYKPFEFNKVVGKYARDIWEKDKVKRKFAEDKGYLVYIIWECDYRKNPKETLNKCLLFIRDNVSD